MTTSEQARADAETLPRLEDYSETHECESVWTAQGDGAYCRICGETLA